MNRSNHNRQRIDPEVKDFLYAVDSTQVLLWLDPPTARGGPVAPLLLNDYFGSSREPSFVGVVCDSSLATSLTAFSLARRLREQTGETVGFILPAEELVHTTRTKIVCVTSSVLVNRIVGGNQTSDPSLGEYSLFFLPNVQWHQLDTHILLTLLKKKDLKVILHSRLPNSLIYASYFAPTATLDAADSIFGNQLPPHLLQEPDTQVQKPEQTDSPGLIDPVFGKIISQDIVKSRAAVEQTRRERDSRYHPESRYQSQYEDRLRDEHKARDENKHRSRKRSETKDEKRKRKHHHGTRSKSETSRKSSTHRSRRRKHSSASSSSSGFLLEPNAVLPKQFSTQGMHGSAPLAWGRDLGDEEDQIRNDDEWPAELLSPFALPRAASQVLTRSSRKAVSIYVSPCAHDSGSRPFNFNLLFTRDLERNIIQLAVDTVVQVHERELADALSDNGVNVDDAGGWGNVLVVVASDYEARAITIALKEYGEQIQGKIRQDPNKSVWKTIRTMEVECVLETARISEKLRLFSTGSSAGKERFSRSTRKVIILQAGVIDGASPHLIPDISCVVDSGFSKHTFSHPHAPLSLDLEIVGPASQSLIIDRASTLLSASNFSSRPSAYYLLMPESTFLARCPKIEPAPTMRDNGGVLLLLLFALCVQEGAEGDTSATTAELRRVFGKMDFLILPTVPQIEKSLEYLYVCGCVEEDGKLIQPNARRLLEWYLMLGDFKLAQLMAISDDDRFQCTLEAAAACAMMVKCPEPFHRNRRRDQAGSSSQTDLKWVRLSKMSFGVQEGDHLSLVNVLQQADFNKDEPGWFSRHMLIKGDILSAIDYMETIINKFKELHDWPPSKPVRLRRLSHFLSTLRKVPALSSSSSNDATDRFSQAIAVSHFTNVVHAESPTSAADPLGHTFRYWRSNSFPPLFSDTRNSPWENCNDLILVLHSSSFYSISDTTSAPQFAVYGSAKGDGTVPERMLTWAKNSDFRSASRWPFYMKHVTAIKPE